MKNNQAFSLVELLISLIVISLITSSFVPILTKKLKYQNATVSSGIVNCKKFSKECLLCDKKQCTICSTQLSLMDGQYVKPEVSCEVKDCPEGCLACKDDKFCFKCDEYYKLKNGKCEKECLKIGNICVQRFNAGDPDGLKVPVGLVSVRNTVSSGASDGGTHTQAICWVGDNTFGCDNANGGYSGCARTVCTWYAADKICKYYNMRLPSKSELAHFGSNSIAKGADGLQLCDDSGGYLSARCTVGARCPGAYWGHCNAYHLWSRDITGGRYVGGSLMRGNWTNARADVGSFALSVRCVRDL